MNKDKLEKLTGYKNKILDRLALPPNEKHKNHPQALKNFLENELRLVNIKIDQIRFGEGNAK